MSLHIYTCARTFINTYTTPPRHKHLQPTINGTQISLQAPIYTHVYSVRYISYGVAMISRLLQ